MAIYYDAPVAPVDLVEFVRSVPLGPELQLMPQFPTRMFDSNEVDLSEIVRTNLVAKYRNFDGSISVSDRDSGSLKKVKLPPLSDSRNEGEYERLQRQFAQIGGTFKERLATAIYNDAEALTRHLQNRLELAWGDLLTDGKVTIQENGVNAEFDFGLPSNHSPNPTVKWSDTTNSKPLSDLISWAETYRKTTGSKPGAIRATQSTISLLQRSKEIINAVHGDQTGKTRANRNELNDLLTSEGLPAITEVESFVAEVDGTDTRAMPDDRVWFTPAALSDLGFLAVGTSATALELVSSSPVDFSAASAPGFVGVVEKVGPPYRQFTFVDGVALPILSDARRLLVAKVQ